MGLGKEPAISHRFKPRGRGGFEGRKREVRGEVTKLPLICSSLESLGSQLSFTQPSFRPQGAACSRALRPSRLHLPPLARGPRLSAILRRVHLPPPLARIAHPSSISRRKFARKHASLVHPVCLLTATSSPGDSRTAQLSAFTYDGGKVSIIRDVDKDLMSYFHVVELAKTVGYKDGDSLYYAIPGRSLEYGIDLLKDDASVFEMMKYANETNFLEIYIQQSQFAAVCNLNIGEGATHATSDKLMALIRKQQYRIVREPCRFDPASRSKNLNDMIYESDILCVQNLRMDRHCFWTLCSLVTEIGGLRAIRNVSVEEMVAMFLHILAYDDKSRSMRTDYQRSIETISRHFNNVLAAVRKLWRVLLRTPQPIPANCKDERWKWFKCLVEVEKENAAVMNDIKTALVHEVEVQKQIDAQCDQLFAALCELPGFSDDEIVKAAQLIGKDVQTLKLFFRAPADKKCAFVRNVLASAAS
ncbi:hypothetical protein EJB05_23844, partial [Eragrostis curvula]